MNNVSITNILKKIALTVAFPALMFVVMTILTMIKGTSGSYLSTTMLTEVAFSASLTTIIALSIFLQFKNGRFDFSGGATMILTAILAGNIAKILGGNPFVFLIIAVVIGVVLSLLTATAYTLSRVPIIICTIAVTLVYESVTYLVFDAEGINIISNPSFALFGKVPQVFLPLVLALAAYIVFCYFTTEGRRGKLLSGNQKVAVNVGIDEKRNVYATYIVSGILLGLAAVVYASRNTIGPQANLSTSGILFSYIVPVFIGMFLGRASIDAVGIVVASIGMAFMNYGLNCLGLGAGGWQQIIFGVFMMVFYAFSGRIDDIKRLFTRRVQKKG